MPRVYYRKPDIEKYCVHCGQRMARKRYRGTLESNLSFRRRKFCGFRCMGDYKLGSGKRPDKSRSKEARRHLGTWCVLCISGRPLQIHHWDENHANNEPSNVGTLCIRCHARWHWRNGKQKRISPPCEVCGEPSRKAKMCELHFMRRKKYGDPLLTKIRQKGPGYVYDLIRVTPRYRLR